MSKINVALITGEECASCYAVQPEITTVAKQLNIPLQTFSAAQNMEKVSQWNIEKIPAVVLLLDDTPVAKCYGYQPQEILSIWLEAKIKDIRCDTKGELL